MWQKTDELIYTHTHCTLHPCSGHLLRHWLVKKMHVGRPNTSESTFPVLKRFPSIRSDSCGFDLIIFTFLVSAAWIPKDVGNVSFDFHPSVCISGGAVHIYNISAFRVRCIMHIGRCSALKSPYRMHNTRLINIILYRCTSRYDVNVRY